MDFELNEEYREYLVKFFFGINGKEILVGV